MSWFWLGVILISLVVEALTQQLVSIWFAAAGLITLILSYSSLSQNIQFVIFLVLAACFMFLVRQWAQNKLSRKIIATNVDSLLGRKAIVVEELDNLGRGQVKIDGVQWIMTLDKTSDKVNVGDSVEIIFVDGAKLVVRNIKTEMKER